MSKEQQESAALNKQGGGNAPAQEESKGGLKPVAKSAKNQKSIDERITELEGQLDENQWLAGQKLSSLDREAVDELIAAGGISLLSPLTTPNLFSWFSMVSKFSPEIRQNWPKMKAQKKQD